MAIFQMGQFKLHSGRTTAWRIECNNLTDEDWETLAQIGAKLVGPFGSIFSAGGAADALAYAMAKFCAEKGPPLIVDDVLTTGKTMEQVREFLKFEGDAKGLVAFARGPCPSWVKPIFAMPLEIDGT